ncbi:DUF6477 family protein [Alkalilacustris brevis]|uniref:DUF6477 family protein n=1 Tax=Alkalilacustris brevis TaxID=2026338 RepID=UPI00192E563F|nr:DUF6477 family protein [Alkalilacustris brevis]
MPCLHNKIAKLRRPKLLIRAARFGLAEYRRTQVLQRLHLTSAANGQTPLQDEIVARLFEMEAHSEAQRQSGDPAYRVARHVELMIALMAEASLLAAPEDRTTRQPGAARPEYPRAATATRRPASRVHPLPLRLRPPAQPPLQEDCA